MSSLTRSDAEQLLEEAAALRRRAAELEQAAAVARDDAHRRRLLTDTEYPAEHAQARERRREMIVKQLADSPRPVTLYWGTVEHPSAPDHVARVVNIGRGYLYVASGRKTPGLHYIGPRNGNRTFDPLTHDEFVALPNLIDAFIARLPDFYALGQPLLTSLDAAGSSRTLYFDGRDP